MCLSLLTYMIYFPNAMARCSLFVLKVLLNTKQTNKPPCSAARLQMLIPVGALGCRPEGVISGECTSSGGSCPGGYNLGV